MGAQTTDLEARLDDRLRSEASLARCCAVLLRRGGVKPARYVFAEALAPLREASAAGRAYIFENFQDERGFGARRVVEVLGDGVASASDQGGDEIVYTARLSRWQDVFARGEPVQAVLSDLSPDEAEVLSQFGIKSLLAIPVLVAGQWWGLLGFDDVENERRWTQEDIRLLQTAAVVIGAFIERAAMQEHLHVAQAHLLQTEKMATIGALVAGVAHEINTPLGAIRSMQDTMRLGLTKLTAGVDADDPKVAKALKILNDAHQVIHSATHRVLEIVRRLKDFARYDEGDLERINLHDEIDDTLMLAHHELKHGVVVEKAYADIPEIEGYPNQLNQVFLNLIVNAKQAMDGKGVLTLTTSRLDGVVEIRVTDNGPGIAEDLLEQIFEPGVTTKKKGSGLGLGLAICQQIIKKHHGRIWAENRPQGGAMFVVRLPIDQPEATEAESAPTTPADPAS